MTNVSSIRANFSHDEPHGMGEEEEESNSKKKEGLDLSDFVDWVNSAESGIKLNGVELRDCGPRVGFGVFATRSIRWNEKVMQIPKRLIITANAVAEIADYQVFLKRNTLASPFSAFETLVLFFYMEEWYRRHCCCAGELIEHTFDRLFVDDSCRQSAFSNERADSSANGERNSLNVALSEFYRLRNRLISRQAGDGRSWLDASRCDRWFNAYLSILPRRFDTAVAEAFSAVVDVADAKPEVERIAGQLPFTARQHFRKQVAEFEALYDKMKVSLDDQLEVALLLWAWHIVNTRCIWVDTAELVESDDVKPDEQTTKKQRRKKDKEAQEEEGASDDCIAIIPMLDIFNHRPDAQCFAAYDRRSATYCVETRTSAVAEDTELFVCYGPHNNARLWLEYGFRLETRKGINSDDDSENVFNRVDFLLDLFIVLVRQWSENNSEKTPAQWRFTAEHERTLRAASLPCTLYASDDSPSFGLKTNCKIALLPVQQLKDWRRVVFVERDSADSGTDENDELAEEGEETTVADQLLYAILTEMRRQLIAKMERTVREARFRFFWTDQIRILDRFIDGK